MSWDTEMVVIVRNLIGDVDEDDPTYPDERIESLILIASLQTNLDAVFAAKYSVNLDNGTLSPDPTGSGGSTRDEAFMSLASLRAAYILSVNEFKIAGNQSIRIKDGESEIDLRRDPRTLELMRDTFKAQYEEKLYMYKIDQSSVGLAVFGPLTLPWTQGGC